ncbi:acyltransferase family protein [Siphonobacter aquaeclarae]|uniref:Predicted acyltransferase n=1 Tax=Siphonobacter aquaeclarae TaxID=563176 RepID=A0A1G9WWJ5_9BACT|nr:heparan-alpha-glucosaminide N-acetyltransferase domain-containing protein [Siphonobacter aquaeclarae]SDM88445.1 Predicted acyltransferase [Siphonobacter aquaeclarae]
MSQTSRLVSLDALRGFTIAAMIVVNFPGSEAAVFPTLSHSRWNGLTFTDLVAPFFLFFVGMSIALAFSHKRGQPGLYRKILIRSLRIYAVGMLLNLLPDFDFSDVRWTGTLHRIAIVFGVCASLYLSSNWKVQASVAGFLVVEYWLVMTLIPTPGYGKVMLEPGQNLAAWVDSLYLPGKMWQGTWDPEGILSTFPSIATGITGMLAGQWMLTQRPPEEKTIFLMIAGLVSASAGYFWGLIFPVNENLWTSSFVLVTSGFASLLFGTFYYIVDIRGDAAWTCPGIIFGSNAIVAYVLADVFALVFYRSIGGGEPLNEAVVGSLTAAGMGAKGASLLYALLFVGVNFIPVWWLYRKRIFIRL